MPQVAEQLALAAEATDVELAPELREEVAEFVRNLPNMDCYQILGIERTADADGVRAGFFARSRRFHPDRYFNKQIGPYAVLFNEIYKRVAAANEVLRDPDLRRNYDKTLPEAAPAEAVGGAAAPEGGAPPEPLRDDDTLDFDDEFGAPETPARPAATTPQVASAPKKKLSLRDRAKARAERQGTRMRAPLAGLDGLSRQLQHSRNKAKRHWAQAEQSAADGRYEAAVRSGRMAVAFDPREARYQEGLGQWLPHVNAKAAATARKTGEEQLAQGDALGAVESLAHAFTLVPTDAELAFRVAKIAFESQIEPERMLEFAECAVALEESCPRYRKLLGMVYKSAGRADEARRELQRVWELDPLDKEVKAALLEL